MAELCDFGLIGLAVMGENLALNVESRGYSVAVFNRTTEKVDEFINGRAKGKKFVGCHSVEELVKNLKTPRKVMMMVKAGEAVDALIEQLLPHMSPGDVLIDGGNEFYANTERRTKYIESKGLQYIGTGVSGGEEGALKGPSMMPGGSEKAWPLVKPIFQAIAAKVGPKNDIPCCEWVGPRGAGHYVKMVHNGIEYGDMQLIAESYDLMRSLLNMSPDEMAQVFEAWNRGPLESYLIEITAKILKVKDADGLPLIDKILDAAGQKGTGKWACIEGLHEGVPLTIIAEAVFARCLSAAKEARVAAGKRLFGPETLFQGDRGEFLENLGHALYAAKIASYAQGYQLMRAAAATYGWNLNYGGIALMWRGGCIIRSAFLGKIKEAFDRDPDLDNLMLDPTFAEAMNAGQKGLRAVCALAALHGVPTPSMMSALSYYDGCRAALLPANLLQAQRDFFGAHTYERLDAPRGAFFHTNWTGEGGTTSSTTYNA